MCMSGKCIQCEYCSESFGVIAILIRHIEAEHKEEKVLHRCDETKCNRFFEMKRLKDLHGTAQHQLKEAGNLFGCKTCSKAFKSHIDLVNHEYRHRRYNAESTYRLQIDCSGKRCASFIDLRIYSMCQVNICATNVAKYSGIVVT